MRWPILIHDGRSPLVLPGRNDVAVGDHAFNLGAQAIQVRPQLLALLWGVTLPSI